MAILTSHFMCKSKPKGSLFITQSGPYALLRRAPPDPADLRLRKVEPTTERTIEPVRPFVGSPLAAAP